MRIKIQVSAIILALMVQELPSFAATTTWTGTAGDFFWATPGNWDAGEVPAATNDAVIASVGTAVQIPTGTTVPIAGLKLGTTGGASLDVVGTLTMTGAVYVSCNATGNTTRAMVHDGGLFNWTKDCTVGYRQGTGILSLSGGTVSAQTLTVGVGAFGASTRSSSKGVLVADDFDLTLSGGLGIGGSYASGYYTNRNGGNLNCSTLVVGGQYGSGVLALESGKLTASSTIEIARYNGSTGTVFVADGAELIGTTLTLGGGSGDIGILEGGAATVRQTKWGGAIKLGTVSGTKGVFVLRGTAIRQAEAGDLLLGTSSSITGYGSVNSSFTASFASVLDNSGTITASGFGAEQSLVFSGYSGIDQTSGGTGSTGWYAEDGGRLVLPSITTPAGNTVTNLAETQLSATLDLVNAVRVSLNNAVAGSLSFKLYAPERSDVPAGLDLNKTVSVWQLTAPTFDSAGLVFKLPAVEPGANLYLLRFVGTKWVVAGTVDTDSDTASATGLLPGGVDKLGFFAVAPEVPFAGSVIVVK